MDATVTESLTKNSHQGMLHSTPPPPTYMVINGRPPKHLQAYPKMTCLIRHMCMWWCQITITHCRPSTPARVTHEGKTLSCHVSPAHALHSNPLFCTRPIQDSTAIHMFICQSQAPPMDTPNVSGLYHTRQALSSRPRGGHPRHRYGWQLSNLEGPHLPALAFLCGPAPNHNCSLVHSHQLHR